MRPAIYSLLLLAAAPSLAETYELPPDGIDVIGAVSTVTVTPSTPSTLTSIGATQQLSAAVADALGQPMGTAVTWNSWGCGSSMSLL